MTVFKGKTIKIDGKKFDGATFEECTFTYSGGKPASFNNCTFVGNGGVRFLGPAADTIDGLKVMIATGMLSAAQVSRFLGLNQKLN